LWPKRAVATRRGFRGEARVGVRCKWLMQWDLAAASGSADSCITSPLAQGLCQGSLAGGPAHGQPRKRSRGRRVGYMAGRGR